MEKGWAGEKYYLQQVLWKEVLTSPETQITSNQTPHTHARTHSRGRRDYFGAYCHDFNQTFLSLTFLGNAVILIYLLNMMQKQEYKDWKHAQNCWSFGKLQILGVVLLLWRFFLRSHCMLIIPCKTSVLYGWNKCFFFLNLQIRVWLSTHLVFTLSFIYSVPTYYSSFLQKASENISQKAKLLLCFSSVSHETHTFLFSASHSP